MFKKSYDHRFRAGTAINASKTSSFHPAKAFIRYWVNKFSEATSTDSAGNTLLAVLHSARLCQANPCHFCAGSPWPTLFFFALSPQSPSELCYGKLLPWQLAAAMHVRRRVPQPWRTGQGPALTLGAPPETTKSGFVQTWRPTYSCSYCSCSQPRGACSRGSPPAITMRTAGRIPTCCRGHSPAQMLPGHPWG